MLNCLMNRAMVITGTLVLSSLLGWLGFGYSPDWVTISGTECQVWDQDDVDGTVSWSGGCKDNYADGLGTLSLEAKDGSVIYYEGTFTAGKMNGRGVWSTSDGVRYEGNFEGSQFQGWGVFSWDGNKFEGPFAEDHPSGMGRCRDPYGNTGNCMIDDDWQIVWVN